MRAQKATYRQRVVVIQHRHTDPTEEAALKRQTTTAPAYLEERGMTMKDHRREMKALVAGFRSLNGKAGMRFKDKTGTDEIVIYTGFICSTDGTSHHRADNVNTTVVYTDVRHRMAEDSDDEHEMSFKVSDPRLMSLVEAERCKDEAFCIARFHSMYPAHFSRRISKALRRASFEEPEQVRRERETFAEMFS